MTVSKRARTMARVFCAAAAWAGPPLWAQQPPASVPGGQGALLLDASDTFWRWVKLAGWHGHAAVGVAM